jgi:hypothetical protein
VGFWWPKASPPEQELPDLDDRVLATSYDDWLAARAGARAAHKKARPERSYPVFIIAAEGGGIYAAAAAATFLSRLQERCPSFAQHVFAISGVSGGSVGAAVFHSAVQDKALETTTGCEVGDSISKGISKATSDAIRADHLSPLLGFMVADLLGRYDRADGLEQSLVRSTKGMDRPFDEHWDLAKAAPALVLNATWVENGYRVAFAPFTLQSRKGTVRPPENPEDTTLHFFRDRHFNDSKLRKVSLAGAAVVSARFPAILPAFILRPKDEQSTDERSKDATSKEVRSKDERFKDVSSKDGRSKDDRPKEERYWNFVDGGYKDSSGALTALTIFNVVKRRSPSGVRPRLILLTNKRPQFESAKIDGTSASDMLGPLIAMLRVRDRLAEDAVIRTVAHLARDENVPGSQPEGSDDGKVWAVVETDPETFNLSLGWRISDFTHKIVSAQMGYPDISPDLCTKEWEPLPDTSTSSWVPTLVKNSCVMRSIVRAVSHREEDGPRKETPN